MFTFRYRSRFPGLLIITALLAIVSISRICAATLGTAFTYQGQLREGGVPANGRYDLRFELFNSETGGSPSSSPVAQNAVFVSNGLFSVSLDFGANVFNGANCWLQIGVRPAESPDPFVTLSPRQSLTPAPYSLYTLKAESLAGPLPDSQLSTNVARLNANQTFTGSVLFSGQVGIGTPTAAADLAVQGSVRAASFSGNGNGLSNVVASGLSASLVQKLWRVPIPFVTVGNPGNQADARGDKGSVAYEFRIGKYEINNNQYVVFLNSVAAEDPHNLYNTNMMLNAGGGIKRTGAPGEYSYSVKPGMEHLPVVFVDFNDALRFCNWLHNGQPAGSQDNSTTEDGAYTITPEGISANNITRNPGARFWLPSDDEWYKAAYHQPYEDDGDPSDFWLYPTRSNDTPFSEPPPGGANSINACCETGRVSTDVGSYFHSPSYYGTFDQGGNAQEWTEEVIYVTNRRLRGGSYVYNEFYSKSTDIEFDTTDYDSDAIGFRVAGAPGP